MLFVNRFARRSAGEQSQFVRQDILRFHHAKWDAGDIVDLRAGQRAQHIGKEVEAYLHGWVDELDEEFWVTGVRQVEVRHEKIGRHRGAHRVNGIGDEINVVRRTSLHSIVARAVDVQVDSDASRQGDSLGVQMGKQPTETVVKGL
jgi:hypothetical protein